ncbi:MAG: L,D-transpeptidase family protein [Rhodospirillales bacterium]
MEINVWAPGTLSWKGKYFRCAIGRGGIAANKVEGDGVTPVGVLSLRQVFYRPDRLGAPETGLAVRALELDDGWCDEPTHDAYNRLVKTPFAAGHETLWRDDGIYDIIVVIGYNDDPVVTGKGSAIFLHVAKEGYKPTQGCVALTEGDLLALLRECADDTRMNILTQAPPDSHAGQTGSI